MASFPPGSSSGPTKVDPEWVLSLNSRSLPQCAAGIECDDCLPHVIKLLIRLWELTIENCTSVSSNELSITWLNSKV